MDKDSNDQSEIKTENESLTTNQPEEILLPETASPERKKRKKKTIIIATVLLVIAMGVTAWFLTKDKKTPQAATDQSQTAPTENPNTQGQKLFGVSYAYGDAEKDGMELFWRPINGGDRRSAKNIGQKNYIGGHGVYKNKVFANTSPGSGSSEGETIWYSEDSGRTYEKLISLDLPEPDKLGDQITSAIFSKDGSSIVYAVLPAGNKPSVIRSFDLKLKQPKDLFTVTGKAVFLIGFDSQSSKAYYNTGCYNCDGNTFNKLFENNLVTKQETELYDMADKVVMSRVMRSDYSKLLVLSGSSSDDALDGGGPPYVLQEFDFASRSFKQILPSSDIASLLQIGYRDNDNVPYYSNEKTIYAVKDDGTKIVIIEVDKPIVNVLYVGQDQVIASSGTNEDYSLQNFTLNTKAAIEILKGDQSTDLFGVTSE